MKMLFLSLFIIFAFINISFSMCLSCHEEQNHYTEYGCTTCHKGNEKTKRLELAHYKINIGKYSHFLLEDQYIAKGEKLIEVNNCRRCHTIGEMGNSLASDLDESVKRLTPQEITLQIKEPNEQMPQFNFTEEDITYVINVLLRNSFFKKSEDIIQLVHFSSINNTAVFNEKCGGCHRMLSYEGALGYKSLAPFLSGLYNKYYPLIEGKQWSKELLEEWLENPRKIKNNAVMPVIKLTKDEKADIIPLFEDYKETP